MAGPEPSELEYKILTLLEEAGIAPQISDQIMVLVTRGEMGVFAAKLAENKFVESALTHLVPGEIDED